MGSFKYIKCWVYEQHLKKKKEPRIHSTQVRFFTFWDVHCYVKILFWIRTPMRGGECAIPWQVFLVRGLGQTIYYWPHFPLFTLGPLHTQGCFCGRSHRSILLSDNHNPVMKLFFSAPSTLCEGNLIITKGLPSQRASDTELWYFHNVGLHKLYANSQVASDLTPNDVL